MCLCLCSFGNLALIPTCYFVLKCHIPSQPCTWAVHSTHIIVNPGRFLLRNFDWPESSNISVPFLNMCGNLCFVVKNVSSEDCQSTLRGHERLWWFVGEKTCASPQRTCWSETCARLVVRSESRPFWPWESLKTSTRKIPRQKINYANYEIML